MSKRKLFHKKESFGDELVHMGIQADYTVRTNNDSILAIDFYVLNTVGSSSTIHNFYTIDKANQKLLDLKDLFVIGSDYQSIISSYIETEMKSRIFI